MRSKTVRFFGSIKANKGHDGLIISLFQSLRMLIVLFKVTSLAGFIINCNYSGKIVIDFIGYHFF